MRSSSYNNANGAAASVTSSTTSPSTSATNANATNNNGAGSAGNNANSTIVNNVALKLNEQCNISKLSTATAQQAATNNTVTNNFNLNEFNAMKTHNAALLAQQQQQQQQLVGPQLGLMQQQQNNDNSINNLLISNNANNHVTTLNMNSKIWSSQQQQQLQHLQQQNLYQTSSNNFNLDSTMATNHCSEAMISSLWGSESSSSGCSSGSGSQPSLSPTLLTSAPNYRSNSKESLWSQQTSPSTSSSGCGNQLRDTYYTGSSKLSTTNASPTSWSIGNQQQQQQQSQQQAHLLYDTNELSLSKMNNIWEIPQQNANNTNSAMTSAAAFNHHDLFPELWSNLNGQHNTITTDNISDISSNTSTSNNECADIWRSNGHQATNGGLMQPPKAMFGTGGPATNLNMNENNPSGLGAAACMQLFSDEFLFM